MNQHVYIVYCWKLR